MRRHAFVVYVLLAAYATGSAQDVHVQQLQRVRATDANETRANQLTKEEQLRIRQLLESAEAGTAALDAASRVVAYAELAQAYKLIDKKKATSLLESGLIACRDLQLESADKSVNHSIRYQLQERVVRDFASLAPEHLDEMMDQLLPEMRAVALGPMIPYYGKVNRLNRASEMVMYVAQEGEMPYGSAIETF